MSAPRVRKMDSNSISRRVCIQREVNLVVDQGNEDGITSAADRRQLLRGLAQIVGETDTEVYETERAMLVCLAAYAQAVVESLDRQAAA